MDTMNETVERIDPLTGAGNLIAFLETFSHRLASGEPNGFSLLLVDLNHFMEFNNQYGHQQGDAVLRWVGIVLKDLGRPVYRIGGDEILVALEQGDHAERERMAHELYERLNRESGQFELQNPASVMLIHFQDEKLEIGDVWIAVSDALFDAKVYDNRGFIVNTYSHQLAANHYQMRVLSLLTERLLSFATRLDATHQIAYLDPITQLPNSIAAEREMQRAIEKAHRETGLFSILFIDGDNLRLYNDISYLAGDQMLRRLSDVMSHHLRPGDFIARWRVGDEFLVVLPRAARNDAVTVAERLRCAVEKESKAWEIPVTISIGVASYPMHGDSVEALLHSVEKAAKQSKDKGKNQTTVSQVISEQQS